jgi:hypothetical protein
MILLKELSGLPFRDDILRGVRLFAIVFAGILLCVAAYRIQRAPSGVEGAAKSETAQPPEEPSSDAAPVSEASEAHPLVVPEPPPVPGAPVVHKVIRPRDPGVPPPPPIAPVVHARRAPAPTGREFESSEAVALPAAPVEDASEARPVPPKQPVGYKSLIEANANRPPVEPAAPAPAAEPGEAPAKGNRFLRAVGKIFHPSPKKDTTQLTLKPEQQ